MTRDEHRRRAIALTAALVLAAGTTGCASGAAGGSATATAVSGTHVEVRDNTFKPSKLQVQASQSVTWTWRGRSPHDVTFSDVASDVQKAGSFARAFTKAGEHTYQCRVHPGMRGTIVVVDAA